MRRDVLLLRNIHELDQTLGNLYVFDEQGQQIFHAKSLERGWHNNQRSVSCIPQGYYPLVFEWSHRFKRHLWELKDVPGRSEVKIHVANFWRQLEGCIALGRKHVDIDSDSSRDVTSSGPTIEAFHKAMTPLVYSHIRIVDF